MSVSFKIEMTGDLDNPAHREAADAILKSVEAVLNAHVTLGTVTLSIVEENTIAKYGTLGSDPKSTLNSHKITATSGFHINTPVKPVKPVAECPDKQE